MKIMLLGDISLHGYWSRTDKEMISQEFKELLFRQDLVLCNLESTVKNKNGYNKLKVPRLWTTSASIKNLKHYNIGLCNLANNHVQDNLDAGVEKTIKALNESNISYSGVHGKKVYELERGTKKISIISYVDQCTHPSLPKNCNIAPTLYDLNSLINDIRFEKSKNNFVIVSLHWGYSNKQLPTQQQRSDAAQIVSSGADIVWGHHPHVIQQYEIINGKPVFYSMGNTCFDDIDQYNLFWYNENNQSIACSIEINKDGRIDRIEPFVINKDSSKSISYIDKGKKVKAIPSIFSGKIYLFYFSIYDIKYFIIKVYRFFFGIKRSPFKQLLELRNRLMNFIH